MFIIIAACAVISGGAVSPSVFIWTVTPFPYEVDKSDESDSADATVVSSADVVDAADITDIFKKIQQMKNTANINLIFLLITDTFLPPDCYCYNQLREVPPN